MYAYSSTVTVSLPRFYQHPPPPLRHLPDLVSPSTNYRKQNNGQDSSFLAWDMFRNLCRALDFNTDALVVNGGLQKEISKFLARIRPTNLYEYNLHDQTNTILAMLNTIQRRPVELPTGVTPLTTSNAMLQVSHRIGIPHQAYHTTVTPEGNKGKKDTRRKVAER